MRDIQLQSSSQSLPIRIREKELFCTCCANDAAKSLEELYAVKAEVFPIVLLCGAFRCGVCGMRTGLLYEVRAEQA